MHLQVADHYLTGNVKGKLAQAESAAAGAPRFAANVEALLAVQPPDLEPVDISVQLGSTWVPSAVIEDFGRHLFGPESVNEISYHPALGGWAIEFERFKIDQTLAVSTWGTERYPGHRLMASILNHTPIKVMDEVGRDPATDRPILKLNEEETAAANQKADEMKQAFKDWVWAEQGRRENLARIYNDTFNTHVPRKYNGGHLELPGSSLAINLRPHQKDAIWRGIQDGTALFDHVVGAGKTLVVVGTIMESKRMGLMKKPMVVVPNHLLTQWQDAFYSLYPQANILVADKNDFKKENREKLFGRVATGDWDAVVVAHSSFKKIGLPTEALNNVLNEEVDNLTKAISDLKAGEGHRGGRLVKEMEKTRERLIATMEHRANAKSKDKVATFADLGVDALFVDESQEFKNLFITTKLRNVAGLGNIAGSEKAFDLYVKCRYLQDKQDGKGVFFATGTPISNTIAEMYTVQRFLQYDTLKEKNLVHFDAWASTFGEVATGWELDATGVGYKLNSRFAKFQNVPELINTYRTTADVITKSGLLEKNQGRKFTPNIKGGKPRIIVAERSELQAMYMGLPETVVQADGSSRTEWTLGSIIERMENLPKDPREDNPLKITNDARKCGLDYRLIDPTAPDFEGSKINLAANEIVRVWQEWEAEKGTQLVFCDLSTPKPGGQNQTLAAESTTKDSTTEENEEAISMDEILSAGSKFSVYDDLKAKLIAKGIPAHEIRYIHEANTDAQKAKLFEQVNQGQVRVLMGSTSRMGAGTNVQKRLVAEHQLDAPWRPSDIEQREGRIERQGNMFFERDPENFEIEIIRYATKQTYDSRMWQTIESKANGIEQFRNGDNQSRTIDDVTGEAANAAEMKAAATGNELIFTQVKLAADLKKLEAVYQNFQRSQHQLERRIAALEAYPEQMKKDIARFKEEIAHRDQNTSKTPFFAAQGKIFTEKDRGALLGVVGAAMKKAVQSHEPQEVGKYRGFKVYVESQKITTNCQFVLEGKTGLYQPANLNYGATDKFDIHGFLQRMDNYLDKFEKSIEATEDRGKAKAEELALAKESQGKLFPQMELLEALRRDNQEVMRELRLSRNDSSYKSEWMPSSLNLNQKGVREKKAKESEKLCKTPNFL